MVIELTQIETKPLPDNENVTRILQVGWHLFEQKGYRGVSLDELCEHCGLSKPTVYYYFHNKENLFVQVLRYKLQGFHNVIEQPGTIRERLERTAHSILESFHSDYNNLMRDREHIKQPEALLEIKNAFHSELFGPLNELMRQGIDEGKMKGHDPKVLTLIFLGMINNFIDKAEEMGSSNTELSKMITKYFLEGAKKNE